MPAKKKKLPVNALPKTPASRLQQILDLRKAKLIGKKSAKRLMETATSTPSPASASTALITEEVSVTWGSNVVKFHTTPAVAYAIIDLLELFA